MTGDIIAGSSDSSSIKWAYREGDDSNPVPWGAHKAPLNLDLNGVLISFTKSKEGYLYKREGLDGPFDCFVIGGRDKLSIAPVVPLKKYKGLSSYLFIELSKKISLQPRSSGKIFTDFPVEVAVFNGRARAASALDYLSYVSYKHSLYGRIKDGLICRYWLSPIYETMPELNPLERGALSLQLENGTANWAEISSVLLHESAINIYYSPALVAIQASMRVTGDLTAETDGISAPLSEEMVSSPDNIGGRFLLAQGKTLMEEGY